ncbi:MULTISPECIES: acyl-CoA synthetase [unclassified Sphingomonas]|jgi:long-chain acyl-CoA synthetase|uniref:acyl-CoA synthetase n=1 Tax=unclassified Sphingomonas TaxID=196159 RepID=UPI0025FD3B04|nr:MULTISPECIES: acyl-CoA synthetase [unclassified Sphingomonas]
MHPCVHARTHPAKAAVVLHATGETIDYATLDRRSNQGAHLFRAAGLVRGDVVAVFLENHPRFFDLAWAAQRSGLYLVCLSSRATAAEADYILTDSGAKLLVTSPCLAAVAGELPARLPGVAMFMLDTPATGFRDWNGAAAAMPDTPIADESAGALMLYSSGTTGRPKGVRWALPEDPSIAAPPVLTQLAAGRFGFTGDTVYLSPAPLYHAAPLHWSMTVHRLGGTVVVMEHFDPEEALRAIARYRVTASQWVPTHFVRLLKLPEAVRGAYDLSSLRVAIHAAAPCPVPVKRAMIDWWGPILFEYYSGTEGNGWTMIDSAEWLRKPGSVGRAVIGTPHICDDAANDLPPGREGAIYFEGGPRFSYHNDPAKTAAVANVHGWTTLGDVGRLDEDGYLYLTDRQSFMIISGGVNVYPQEIENVLVTHPRIADAAVVGAPDPDFGEKVVAVIQPVDWADANEGFAEEIRQWLRGQLSGIKVPRQIDFMPQLPREPTGKLYKRLIRDAYRQAAGAAA